MVTEVMIKEAAKHFALRFRQSRGYTLLEYCAGAAVICGIVWVALEALGGNLEGLLNNIGLWTTARSNSIDIN